MRKTFETLQESMVSKERSGTSGNSCNLVIRDMPEHSGENLRTKINNMFRDQLKLSGVQVHSAIRKTSTNSRPGVIITTLETIEDKEEVLKAKSLLRNSSLSNDYIHPDQSHSERMWNSNLRAVVNAVNRGDGCIAFRGGRVVRSINANERHQTSDAINVDPSSYRNRGDSERAGARNPGTDRLDRARSQTAENIEQRSIFGDRGNGQGGARGGVRGGARVDARGGARGYNNRASNQDRGDRWRR
ncbi:hypothetical protein DPMN_075985 [Dreissena polymorpha]|uniref:Uncharacterized protein n=1 Tax=Dreissena polymorpha TaxID=45954 RepID=A0A9D3YHW2_DREPO|nr:hypothetical protein DPMN_075985 [Dreissena polymorpha]